MLSACPSKSLTDPDESGLGWHLFMQPQPFHGRVSAPAIDRAGAGRRVVAAADRLSQPPVHRRGEVVEKRSITHGGRR